MITSKQALTGLPQIDLDIQDVGNPAISLESFKGLTNEIIQMQVEKSANGTFSNVKAGSHTPFASSVWNIVKATGTSGGFKYTCTFVSEIVAENQAIGRAALSVRRPVDIVKGGTPLILASARSFLAALEAIEGVEDRVAEAEAGAESSAFDFAPKIFSHLKGKTPYENYEWSIGKAGNKYTLIATLNSN
jgi:hypothetical protein